MKIEIEIPDEYEKRDIFVFAGIDIVARKFKSINKWEIKEKNCKRCGKCCLKMTGKSFPFSSPNGCKHLIDSGNEKLCGLSYFRPNGCAVAEMNIKDCSVRWKFIE
jgi:hypothetical protein